MNTGATTTSAARVRELRLPLARQRLSGHAGGQRRATPCAFGEAGKDYPYTLITDSVHNIYNMVTVIAALRQLGYDHPTIARDLAEVKIPASRLSEETIGGVKVIMQMSKDKNALACSRNFDYIRSKPGKKELLVMMNCMGVAKSWSENPSWMYDTDFEFLNSDDVTCLVCAGPRAYDYKLRLLLAGIPEEKIRLAEDEFAALELLPLRPATMCISCTAWTACRWPSG